MPDFSPPAKPIAEFARLPDFPRCTLGEHVDIGGSIGVVVDIINQSIKLRTAERTTQSFNSNRLLTLYGPRPELVVTRTKVEESRPTEKAQATPAQTPAPLRQVIEDPNFNGPTRSIAEFVSRPGFPQSAFGAHVEIGNYVGVVVEIVKQSSLRVRCQQGTSRNFSAEGLLKIYGKV